MNAAKTVLLFCFLISCQLPAQSPEQAATKLEAFVNDLPEFAPGYSLVVVTSKKVLLCKASGVLKAGSDSPLTKSTPLYVASQTKSYVGLLAAYLHEKKILRLDDKLTDHWPDIRLPQSGTTKDSPTKGKASDVQLGDLLYHVVPFKVGYITLFEKNIGEIRPELYPFVIEKHATYKRNDFAYDNYGYNIWGAILENSTDKSWREWLHEVVIDELELNHTVTRHSTLEQSKLPWRHIWQGKQSGWFALPPKTDPRMHSAGGLSTSAIDQAKWLQAHLRSGKSKGKKLTAAVFKTAHRSGTGNRKLSPKYELERVGYSLGWNVCRIDGKLWYVHGGGMPGVRSISAFSKDLDVGIAFVANSDNGTSWISHRLLSQFQHYLNGAAKADLMAKSRIKSYSKRIASLLKYNEEKIAKRNADPGWGEWKWNPSKEELSKYCGTYFSDPSFGPRFEAEVVLIENKLRVKLGEYELYLRPARPNLFGASETPGGYAISLRFYQKTDESKPYLFTWNRGKSFLFRLRRKAVEK